MGRIEALKNLMVMAAADGSFTEREIAFLADRSKKWDLDAGQFAKAIEYSLSPDARLILPDGEEDRREMLRELIRMMAADGHLADVEKQLFAVAAAKMSLTREELDNMIDSLLNS
jgi:uncharacterized tellurite resistance protein B-like protein